MLPVRVRKLFVVGASAFVFGALFGFAATPRRHGNLEAAVSREINVQPVVAASAVSSVFEDQTPKEVSEKTPSVIANTASDAKEMTNGLIATKVPVKPGGRVSHRETFGLHLDNGWPVLFVRSLDEENVWYAQEGSEKVGENTFACKATFGNDNTPTGMRFEIAIVTVTDQAEAASYAPGTVVDKLPEQFPSSIAVKVVRQ